MIYNSRFPHHPISMTRAIFGISFCVLIFATGSINSQAQTVSGSIVNETARRGASTSGVIVLDIPNELHVNSNQPKSEYAIPTTVRISGKGVKLSPVTFPPGENRKFQFSENPINVYEGTVFFWYTVTVPKGYKGDSISIKAVVRYQACTNEVCYPPKNKEVTITARVT